jgi:hypothetical protein
MTIDDDARIDNPGRRMARPSSGLPEVDDLVLRIRGLVRERERLRQRGVSDAVLEEHFAEIGRLQLRLAEQVRLKLTPANRGTAGPA